MAKDLFSSPAKMIPGKLRKRYQVSFEGHPSKTRQAPKDGTQIDSILKKYATQGVSPNDVGVFFATAASAPYGVQPSTDYQMMLNEVIRVENYFMSLPSRIREKFGHNAQNMINFVADPSNLEEAQKLGLVQKDPEKPAAASAAAPIPAPGAVTPPVPAPEKKPNPS